MAALTAYVVLASSAAAARPDPVAELDLRWANLVFREAIRQNPNTFGPNTEQTTGSDGGAVERTTTTVKISACFYRYTRGLVGWWCPSLLRHETAGRPPGAGQPIRECVEESIVWKITGRRPPSGSLAASGGAYAKVRLGGKRLKFFLLGTGPHPAYPLGFPPSQPCA